MSALGGRVGSWGPAHLGCGPCREEVESRRLKAQFYSQPALGNPFSWGESKEDPVSILGRGWQAPGLLLRLVASRPGLQDGRPVCGAVCHLRLTCLSSLRAPG